MSAEAKCFGRRIGTLFRSFAMRSGFQIYPLVRFFVPASCFLQCLPLCPRKGSVVSMMCWPATRLHRRGGYRVAAFMAGGLVPKHLAGMTTPNAAILEQSLPCTGVLAVTSLFRAHSSRNHKQPSHPHR